jgi:hypothetical protein
MYLWLLQTAAMIINLWSPQLAKYDCRNSAKSRGDFDTCMIAASYGGDHYI